MDFYVGQIDLFGFNFAPVQWAQCTGTIVPINQNTALFSLLGTTYGGNGTTTFGLPDLRSRTPIGFDSNYPIGEMSGIENIALNTTQMPQHTHAMAARSEGADETTIDGHIFAQGTHRGAPAKAYGPPTNPVTLNPGSVSMVGGSQAHSNLQPLLAVNFCIATGGAYPPRG
ncbi:MAG TPA: tail fiber protein [Pseudolabrys sp.]|nr:tail fiber protein [Pseudolabrys sp.]